MACGIDRIDARGYDRCTVKPHNPAALSSPGSSSDRAALKPNATSRQTAYHRMVVRASDVDDELAAVSAAVEVSILSPQIHSKHRHASISN